MLILFLAGVCTTLAQGRLSLYDLDPGSFPSIRARFLAEDASGALVTGFRPEDVKVTENGIERRVTNLLCSAAELPLQVSVAVSVDLSSSMAYREMPTEAKPIVLAQDALRALAHALPFPQSEMAVQTFDDAPLIGVPFTRQREEIIDFADNLPLGLQNDLLGQLEHPDKGLLNIAKKGAHKRVAILITDSDACLGPLFDNDIQRLIDTCAKYSIRMYALIYRIPNQVDFSFKRLVTATGGKVYDGLGDHVQGQAAIREILAVEQGGGRGCELEWESLPGCPELREVEVSIPAHSLSARTRYRAPVSALPQLRIVPAGLAFGPVGPGGSRTLEVNVRAENFPVTIRSIEGVASPFFLEGVSLPITLQAGESRTLTIRFTPTDSILSFANLRFDRGECRSVPLFLSGGVDRKVERLRVIVPNGGEKLLAGSMATLGWRGVEPEQPVTLEYSIDKGRTWQTIVENATGLEDRWLVPRTPSDSCLLRVSRTGVSRRKINFLDSSQQHTWCDFSPDGSVIAVANGDNSASIRDANTTVELHRLVGHTAYVKQIRFSPDGRYVVTASYDNTARVWEVATGKLVQRLNGHTGLVYSARFSPDGGRIVTAGDTRTIIWLVESGEMLAVFRDEPLALDAGFNRDGSQIITSSMEIVLRDAFTGIVLHRQPDPALFSEISDDGTLMLSAQSAAARVRETGTWSTLSWIVASDREPVGSAQFLSRDRTILTTSKYNIEFWDPYGRLLAQLPTEGIGAFNASLSSDGRRMVSILPKTGSIWELGGAALGADISDSLWSIVLPEEPVELAGSFTLADESICQDECIEPAATSISNVTRWEWTFTGGTPSAATGISPGRICYAQAGRYPVRLIVANATQRDTVTRFVTVVAPPAVPVITQSCGTLVSTSAAGYQWFRDGAPIDGATAQTHRYDRPGSYIVEISNAEGCTTRSAALVTRDEDLSSLGVAVGDVSAAPGEIARVPLTLRFSHPGGPAAWQLTLRLEFNASLLLPIAHLASPRTAGRRSIDVTISGESFRDTVVEIPFRVALGDAPSTALTVDTVGISTACAIALQSSDGVLSLSGLCANGGTRLVETAEASALKTIRPNPVRGEVMIEYSLVESGAIDIALYDLRGRRVATIATGASTPGAYVTSYDLSGLTSGRYLCIYTTPTGRFSEALIVE